MQPVLAWTLVVTTRSDPLRPRAPRWCPPLPAGAMCPPVPATRASGLQGCPGPIALLSCPLIAHQAPAPPPCLGRSPPATVAPRTSPNTEPSGTGPNWVFRRLQVPGMRSAHSPPSPSRPGGDRVTPIPSPPLHPFPVTSFPVATSSAVSPQPHQPLLLTPRGHLGGPERTRDLVLGSPCPRPFWAARAGLPVTQAPSTPTPRPLQLSDPEPFLLSSCMAGSKVSLIHMGKADAASGTPPTPPLLR